MKPNSDKCDKKKTESDILKHIESGNFIWLHVIDDVVVTFNIWVLYRIGFQFRQFLKVLIIS